MQKADIHIHTTRSNGFAEPEDVVQHVLKNTDIDVIAITDHDSIAGGADAQSWLHRSRTLGRPLEVVIGSEISSGDGHILGLFLKENVPMGLDAHTTIDLIHQQGGIAIAAHPFSSVLRCLGMKGVGDLIQTLPFDAVETINSNPTEIYGNRVARWKNLHGQKLPETGGSDAHHLYMIGRAYTLFHGRTPGELYSAIIAGKIRSGGTVCNAFRLFAVTARVLFQLRWARFRGRCGK